MSVTFTKESEDLFVVQVKGIYTIEDSMEVESKAGAEIDDSQKVKLLVLAEEFSGWGKEGDWGDMTFFVEKGSHIEKIAVVANDKWKDELLMFLGAGLRQAAVEFFPDGGEEKARDWLKHQAE
jgi:hypothetical protein